MIGKGGMSLPPPGFSPYLVMSNSSDKPLTVSPVFSYVLNDRTEKKTLPRIALGPRTTRAVNLRDFQDQGVIPSVVEMGNIDLQYKGESGALVAELASVDSNGSFVSPVRLICSGNRDLHMAFWRTDAEWHSSVTIENIASEENDIEVTISYPGGIYVLEQEIAAGGSGMISINELQQSQQPDALGRRIPRDATMGGVNIWSKNIHNGLVINAMLMNPVTRTCGQCTEPGYVMQYTLSDKAAYTGSPLYSGFDPHVIGLGFPIYINVLYSSGSRTQSGDAAQSSTSSNTSVATAAGSYVTAVAPGTTNITANSRSGYFTDTACSQPGYLLPSRVSSLTVVKVDIKQDGTVITNTTRDVIVGQRISLTADVQPTGVTITNQRWTIPPVRVANYVVIYTNQTSATSGTVTTLAANPGGSAVDFYWVDGGDGRQVQIALKVNGVSFTAVTTFNVKRPTTEITSSTGNVSINSLWGNLEMTFGVPSAQGIVFGATVTLPQGFTGSTQWVQLITVAKTRTLTNGTTQTASGTGLDTYYPYPSNEDSPGVDLTSSYIQRTVNDGYQTYLMFKPSMTNSIWVPLGVLNWSWSGTATLSAGTWTLSNASNTQNPAGVATTTHPSWSQNAAAIGYH